jgi:DNA-binding MarR family transcriptional regulator
VKESVQLSGHGDAEDFRLEEFLPFRLAVASEGVSRVIARHYLTRSGLGMPEWRLLAAVGRFGVLSPTAAGEHTSMDKVKVSRAAASLVARGLLRQTQDPEDGRGRLLRLTRKGTGVYAGIKPMAQQIETTLAAGLSKAEWNMLHKALARLTEHTQTIISSGIDGESG